jgi:hypothetical protein
MVFLLPWGVPSSCLLEEEDCFVSHLGSRELLPGCHHATGRVYENGASRSAPMNKVLTKTLQAVRITVRLPTRCSVAVKARRTAYSTPRSSMRSARQTLRTSPFMTCGIPLRAGW